MFMTFLFPAVTVCLWLVTTAVSFVRRSTRFAIVIALVTAVHGALSVALVPLLKAPVAVAVMLQVFAYAPLLGRRPKSLRPRIYYAAVRLPGAFWIVGCMLGLPWAVAATIGYPLPWPYVPFVIAALGLLESLFVRETVVDIVLDGSSSSRLSRHRSPVVPNEHRPLRIVQITDPHLGPFMSEARLRRICERAVERDPDLIVLTGDLLTIDSNADHGALTRALGPLERARGRTFACLGNHDYEALGIVRSALASASVQLLVDEAQMVDTPVGQVQIVGIDFRWSDRSAHLASVCAEYPREGDALRLFLLHDPGAFRHLPEGEADLVLSGHTHGGQVGLVRLGMPHTIVSALTAIPDHGLWARGRDRLYVHRGTGHYGFPLRVGVPAERSLLRVHRLESS